MTPLSHLLSITLLYIDIPSPSLAYPSSTDICILHSVILYANYVASLLTSHCSREQQYM